LFAASDNKPAKTLAKRLVNIRRRIKVRIELSGASLRTKGLECPFIVVFVVPEDVRIAVVGMNAEVQGLRPVPLILDRFDKMERIAQPEFDGPLIAFMARI
jgi:hypothetical protein